MSRRYTAGRFPGEREPWYDPSVVLSGGPQRVSNDDADPGYEPPRIRGFSVADVAPVTRDDVAAVPHDRDDAWIWGIVPRLWQDDGDQA